MLRSRKVVASLIRSLTLGTAATMAIGVATTTLVACKDESQPEYWVDKLEDPPWRARSVKRLEQFYEDAVTKANGDREAPEVKTLVNQVIEPLTNLYTKEYENLDTKTRVTLIKLLGSFKDKRTEPAIRKAFEEFSKRPRTTKDEQDIKWAALAAGEMKLDSVGDAMLQTFTKLKASTMLGGIVYKDYSKAMNQMPQKSWTGTLVSLLEPEIKVPKSAKDRDLIDPYRDQLFWQVTAAEVLGRIGDPSAVEPLLKVMLDPAKADVQATAALALVKIGKPAAEAAAKLLKGESDKLIAFNRRRIKEVSGAREEPSGKPYLSTAALVLGTIGRTEAIGPLVDVLKGNLEDEDKAVVARELTKLPPTPESKRAFKEAFESISIDTVVPPGESALQMLAEAAGQFFDADMVDWLIDRAANTKGSGEDLKALQGTLLLTMLKLAKPDQMRKVKAVFSRYGTKLETDLLAQVEPLVKECAERVDCYLTAIEKSENLDQKNQYAGIKAGYMIGILGDEKERDALVERLDSIDNAAVRFVAAKVIDYLSPKGSPEVAKQLEAIIEKNEKSADRQKAAADAPLKQVMYRVEARSS